ncbi:hypothetical protein CFter6_4662 [Collimonas fungivorans]|uniref:Uncharacterized protein n=1 Tax=Collimonas fungivorans TaxID=158899 RepID=A0A127PHP4_9BURK|nr:hypothetical protein CFter6_4662 [Collimonas fungivorans]
MYSHHTNIRFGGKLKRHMSRHDKKLWQIRRLPSYKYFPWFC